MTISEYTTEMISENVQKTAIKKLESRHLNVD